MDFRRVSTNFPMDLHFAASKLCEKLALYQVCSTHAIFHMWNIVNSNYNTNICTLNSFRIICVLTMWNFNVHVCRLVSSFRKLFSLCFLPLTFLGTYTFRHVPSYRLILSPLYLCNFQLASTCVLLYKYFPLTFVSTCCCQHAFDKWTGL